MTGFPHARLSDLCEINIGRTPSRSVREYWGPGSSWMSIADMNQGRSLSKTKEQITDAAIRDTNIRLVPAGSVLLSFKLSIGKVGIAAKPLFTNEAIASLPIIQPDRLVPEFLYWALQSMDLVAGQDRAVMGLTLNKAKLSQLLVPIPPLTEQLRIAAILDQADALRAKRREALAQLDSLTQSIFIEMFGDPVKNPKGWEILPFGDQFRSVRYGTGSPPPYVEEGVPFIRATNIKAGRVSAKDLRSISIKEALKLAKCRVKRGDLIVVRSGVNTGDCAVIPAEYDGACAAFDLIVDIDYVNGVFYGYLINSAVGKKILEPLTRRAAQPHLNAEQLQTIPFISPPPALRTEFVKRIDAIEKVRATHFRALDALDSLFASLQHRAFRGEL